MMAAAAGAIASGQPADVAKDVATFAAASNLITTTVGTYFTLFVSLPFANIVYRWLEPVLSPKRTRGALSIDEASGIASEQPAPVRLSWKIKLTAVCVAGLLTIFCGNWINSHVAPQKALVGIIMVGVVAIIGDFLACNIPYKVPAVCWVSAVGMLATAPIGPWAAPAAAITSSVNFMPLTTPILAYAGLSLAKDIPAFKRLGWRIVVTSLLANTGTFIAAATLAHFLMHV